jgi:sulfofructose kinase
MTMRPAPRSTPGGPPRVVCIGIATLDAIVVVDRLPAADERVPAKGSRLAGGGVAATAAVALARLGVPVALIGRVGDDTTGRWIRDDLAGEGVDVAGVTLVPGARSPLSAVLVERGSGARALAPDLGDAGPIVLDDAALAMCRGAEWIHVDQLGASVVPVLADAGITTPISLDSGVRPASPVDFRRVALDSPTEAALLARYPGRPLEEALLAALDAGPRIVAVTRGEAGAVAVERADSGPVVPLTAPALSLEAVSTLGAGDVFHGALLAGLIEGRSLADALRRATVCAGLACRGLDGRSAIPTRAALDLAMSAMIGRNAPEAPTPASPGRSTDARP